MKILTVVLCLLFVTNTKAQQFVTEYKQTDSGTVRIKIKKEFIEKIISVEKITPVATDRIAELNRSGFYTVDEKNVFGFLKTTMYWVRVYPTNSDNVKFVVKKEVYPYTHPAFWLFFIPICIISASMIYGSFFDKKNSAAIRWLCGTILLTLLGCSIGINIGDNYHNPLRNYLSAAQLFSSTLFISAIFFVVLASFIIFRKVRQ
jgi:hypothetical protein